MCARIRARGKVLARSHFYDEKFNFFCIWDRDLGVTCNPNAEKV